MPDFIKNLMAQTKAVPKVISDLLSNETSYVANVAEASEITPEPVVPQTPTGRALSGITDDDWEEAKHVLYGEISDREDDKQSLEAETILNTALNRRDEYSKKFGRDVSLAEVLQMENQYQAYDPSNPDSLYSKSKRGEYAEGGERRLKAIESTFEKARKNELADNTNGAYFYIHHDDGSIEYDDQRPLYK